MNWTQVEIPIAELRAIPPSNWEELIACKIRVAGLNLAKIEFKEQDGRWISGGGPGQLGIYTISCRERQ